MIPEASLPHAKVLWDYNHLNQPVTKADCLFVFGSNDLRIADHAAHLAKTLGFTRIVTSGGIAHVGEIVDTGWNRPEADVFAERLIELGIPESHIIRETRAENSGHNVIYSRALLHAMGIEISSGLIVHKPFMERRAYATATAQWPQVNWSVTSPAYTLEEYAIGQNPDVILHTLTGDTARIEPYARLGFQFPQPFPEEVRTAMQALIKLGYTEYLPKLA